MFWKSTLLALVFCCLVQISCQAQCKSSFTVSSNYTEINKGELLVSTNTSSSFECNLFKFQSGVYQKVSSSSGTGKAVVSFEALSKSYVYKVEVIFNDEKSLCSTRQKGGIKF